MYQCQYCGAEHPSASETKECEEFHENFRALGSHLPYVCESCPASFMTSQLLDKHRNSIHELTCYWCLETFINAQALEAHEQCHELNDEEPPFKCFWCLQTFANERLLQSHEHIHDLDDNEELATKCFWCLQTFTNEDELKEHERCHEIEDDPLPERKRKRNNSIDSLSPIAGPSSMGQVGGGNNRLSYTIKKIGERTFRNTVIDRHYRVQFHESEALQGEKLSDLHNELQDMFDELLNQVKSDLQGNDLGRVVITHPDLTSNIVVPLQKLDELTGNKVLEYIENVLTSHQDLALENEMAIDIGTMEIPKGGYGVPINNLFGPNSSLKQKQSIIEIKNTDFLCLARAILMGYLKINQLNTHEWKDMTSQDSHLSLENLIIKYKACPKWLYRDLNKEKCSHRQTELASKLCTEVGVDMTQFLCLNDIPPFEQFFDVDILVVSSRMNNKFIRVPPEDSQKPRIYLYLVENDDFGHYHTIANICGFFAESKFCEHCLKPYRDKHNCEVACFVCKSGDCQNLDDAMSCRTCHMTCRSGSCFDRHATEKQRKNKQPASQCDLYWKCIECKTVVNREKHKIEEHLCDTWECKSCGKFVPEGHLCYIRALDAKESKGQFIFFDIETSQNEIFQCKDKYQPIKTPGCTKCKNETLCQLCIKCKNCNDSLCGKYSHQANLIIAQKCCMACMNEPLGPESKCETCGNRCKKCDKFNKDDKVYDIPPCQKTCGFREVIFKGDNCVTDFGQWLFSPAHKHFIVLAHNMRAFDGYFLLEYLIDQSIRPDSIIFSGSKINYMHVSRGLDIRIIDSLNFLPMPLSDLPAAFELDEICKGFFPHYFNTKDHEQYVGPYPEPKYYGVNSMSDDMRVRFYCWYLDKWNPDSIFDMQKEIVSYCRSDVDILRRACLKFRQILIDITGKEEQTLDDNLEPQISYRNAIDPFNEITIASVCSKVYRTKFLEETWQVKVRRDGQLSEWLPAKKRDGEFSVLVNGNWISESRVASQDMIMEEKEFVKSRIAQIPSNMQDTYSKSSIKWLEWEAEKSKMKGTPIFIQHAFNEREYRLPNTNYRLDGYCQETNTAYEFYGCLWHGCRQCFPKNRHLSKVPRTKQSLEELYALTLKKQAYIQSLGMKLIYIWEHEFNHLLRNVESAKDFVEGLDIQDRLNPRESFFGGRTNAIKLKKNTIDNQKISYSDFCSLYPYCNKYARYPIGHPEIITSGLEKVNLNNIFGIVKCKILPPRQLYFPVLPVKCNGKLSFPLCRTCAERQSQQPCRCSDANRMLLGTWCTPEIQKALEKGYEIIKLYEVYHWSETTQFDPAIGKGGLFSDYINLFLRIKQESSDWPSWVETEADMSKYIDLYLHHEGIRLNRENIRKNKALRSLAKLFLNSMWGKWGQNLNMAQTVYFHEREADKFFRCVSDPNKQVKDFYIVTNDTIQVTYNQRDDFVEESYQTNVYLATFTTCQARLKLYDVLDMLQDRVLYHDTDSVIYISNPSDPEPPLGDYLGELTSELDPGDWITSFVASGPKAYSYKTHKGKQVCKIRGFSLNYRNRKLLNFDSMLDLIERPDGCSITVVNPHKICRDKKKRKIYNRVEEKKYKIVYTKRVIQNDFDTLPYGY